MSICGSCGRKITFIGELNMWLLLWNAELVEMDDLFHCIDGPHRPLTPPAREQVLGDLARVFLS